MHKKNLKNIYYSIFSAVQSVLLAMRRNYICVTVIASVLAVIIFSIFRGYIIKSHTADNIVRVQMLAINDLHGYILPPQGPSGQIHWRGSDGHIHVIQAGGISQLTQALRDARTGHEYSVTVASGDLIGASPLVSGLYQDEPTINILGNMGINVSSVGNHEFDAGWREISRIQHGGCHLKKGCFDPPYQGAKFQYLAANVTRKTDHQLILPPYWIWHKDNIRIGFIGLTLYNTPGVSTKKGTGDLNFAREVPTINKYTRILKSQGIDAIVVLIHQGSITQLDAANDPCKSPDKDLYGPIVQIAEHISPDVDVVVSGHSHVSYICQIPDPRGNLRYVTQASSYGKMFTEFTLPYDTTTGTIIRHNITAVSHYVLAHGSHAADVDRLINHWKTYSARLANTVVGYISSDISGRGTEKPEKPLGVLVADAQNADMKQYGSQFAFTNKGGLRGDIVYSGYEGAAPGTVTYSEVYTVQPFKNKLHVLEFTGGQILDLLRQQVSGVKAQHNEFLQGSSELTYTVDNRLSGISKIIASSVKINGVPLITSQRYRVTVNAFLAEGGDGYTVLAHGKEIAVGGLDSEALEKYLRVHSSSEHPLVPPQANQITFIQ